MRGGLYNIYILQTLKNFVYVTIFCALNMETTLAEHPAKILVSSTRKPVSYVNNCKRYLQEHGEVHLSALGVAVSSAVTVAEILKNRNLAVEKKLGTTLEVLGDDSRTRQKPKMEILLVKSADFDDIMEAEQAAAEDTADVGNNGVPQ